MKLSGLKGSINRRRGITVMEALAWFALFASFLMVAYPTLRGLSSEARAVHNNASDIIRVMRAGERWRQDIREAVRPPQITQSSALNLQNPPIVQTIVKEESLGGVTDLDGVTESLQFLSNPKPERIQITYLQIVKSSHTIWYAFREGSVYRKAGRQPDHWEVVLEKNVASSTMASESRGETVVWRWELELKTTREAALTHPLFSFLSVPQKDQSP